MRAPIMKAIRCGLAIAIVAVASAMVLVHRYNTIHCDGPDSSIYHIVSSRRLLASGDLGDALAAARRAVEIDPGNVDAHLCLGDALAAMKVWPDALASFREAARLRPNSFQSHRGAAHALSALDDTPGAERELRECVRLAPDDAASHANLASNLALQKRFAEAIAEMKRADELASQRTDWKYPTKDWIAEFERELLEHGDAPETPPER